MGWAAGGVWVNSNPEPASDEQRIAENLRAAVKASGLSQRDIAQRVGMDPTALSKVLSGARRVTSRELALICTATRTDVFTVLGTDPFHGPSYRRGYTEARLNLRRALERGESIESVLYRHADVRDGDYTACGAEKDGRYCDLPLHAWPQTHHADVYWEAESDV